MLLPLGILASSGGAALATDYELISTTLVTSAVSSVSFSSLNTVAAAYKHLQIRLTARTTRSANEDGATVLKFNGASTTYRAHYLVGTGSSVVSYDDSIIGLGSFPGNTAGTGQFLPMVADVLDFGSTTNNTTIRMLAGHAGTFNGVRLASGAWFSTAAITSIDLNTTVGQWAVGSRFSLYGLKG